MSVTFTSKHGAAQYFPILKVAGEAAMRAPVALTKAVCIVGRHLGVHLPLAHKQVSKLHALIIKERDRVYVRDLASRNHLLVNGQPVREADLGTGDVVRVGPYALHCASGFNQPESGADVGARAPDASLEINGGVSRVALEGRAILIGSREECDVVLADERVSPVHAVIFELDGKRFVRDFGSMVGTYRNGERIHQEELSSGDELRIGNTRLRYVEGGAAPVDAVELDSMDQEIEAAIEDAESDDRVALEDDTDRALGISDDLITMGGDPEDGSATEHSLHADDDELVTLEVDPDHDEDDEALPAEEGRADAEEQRRESETAPPSEEQERKPPLEVVSKEDGDRVVVDSPADEGLIPLLEGDRTVGVIDAAVQSAVIEPHERAVDELDLTESGSLAPLPLMSMSGSDAAVGGLPLPPGAAVEGYGEFEDDEVTSAELGIEPHKPLSPEETIVPDSGPDGLVGEPPKPRDPADPAHPLFELVQQLREEIPEAATAAAEMGQPAASPDDTRAAAEEAAPVGRATEGAADSATRPGVAGGGGGDPRDLEDLLKYDGADVTPLARDPDASAEAAKEGRKNAVRKLDRLVHELSDRVADLKSTWKQVKQGRPAAHPAEHPPTRTEHGEDKRDASPD
jgi:pSer/pThr/pTyr-binding forkhead associated (FHA) protein